MRLAVAVSLVMVLLGGSACSPFQRHDPASEAPGASHVVSDVPYFPQQARNDCGPAALASLLAYRGIQVSVSEITDAVYTPALKGTLLPDMENYARSLGLSTRSGRGDLALLRHTIDSGRPVLALLETGLWVVSRPHYVVVYGYDDSGLLAHVGTRAGIYVENGAFLDRWKKMNRLYLYLE